MAEIIQIDANTWRIEDNGVRFFVLSGENKALMIDSGMNTPDALEIARTITPLPIELLNTHADPDHISGNDSFPEFYMSPNEADNLNDHGKSGRIIPVKTGDTIDLGGRVLEIIDNPGHTPGSVAILDISNRVLYSGDSVQDSHIFMFGKHRDMHKYTDSLKSLKSYTERFDKIFPSHGSIPVEKELIDKLIAGAEMILNNEAQGRIVEMFGNEVMLYRFDFAGFLCAK